MRAFHAALRAATLFAVFALAAGPLASRACAQGDLLPLPAEKPIRGALFPAPSPDGRTLCFGYLGDLWTVPITGGLATRLTIHQAQDAYPRWSPDGKWIAFTSNREGNYDVYVVAAIGGTPRQLTFQSGNDWGMDWSPDGRSILFYGQRGATTFQLYSIDVATGVVHTITNEPESMIRYGAYSPDGNTVAYDRCGSIAVWWRPKYHGSANMDIYAKSLRTGKITRISDYDGSDLWPMYSPDGKTIYYVTDQASSGASNIVARSANGGGHPSLVTHYKEHAVRWPAISRHTTLIAYEYDGDLYSLDAKGGSPQKLNIIAPSDEKVNNIQHLSLTNGATEVEISPDGKTVAIVDRGEIWTVPAGTGGDAKRMTNTTANDYDIVWSKDSSKIAFISDRNGNFDVFTLDPATKGVKAVSTDPNDETSPHYSPDGKWLAFLRSGTQGGIYVVPSDGSAQPRRVVESLGNNLEFGVGINSYSWSPDNKWIAFSRRDSVETADVWVVPVAGGPARNVTYYPGQNTDPEWTSDGKYLLFLSPREGPPDIYKIPLEPEKEEPDTSPSTPAPSAPSPAEGRGGTAPKPMEVKIDFDDIENRAKRLTTQGAAGFEITPDGKSVVFISASGGAPDFFMVPVAGGSALRMTNGGEGTGVPRFFGDPNRFYAMGAGGTIKVLQRMGPMWMAQPVAFSARMDFDRKAEIHQAFNEFWRRMNVGFYDPNMHGVDWRAVRARYEPLLEGVGTKEEFSMFLLSGMVGELNASHSEPSPAPGAPGPQTAELGMTFDETYIGPGLKVANYMPKGPDDDLGPRIKPGEYILSIDGEDVSWNESMYNQLQDKAGKTVELLVNSKPSKDGARTVKLKPITKSAWNDLEYERRVKVARDEVEKLSGGRLAYLHIKGMDQPSLQRLQRELWGKAKDKDGLVLDIRNNGGGNTHDQILAQLSRPLYGYTQPRDAAKVTQPVRYWGKPIVLLINENSASDAEIFPMGFRNLKLGKIVGEPTPGYVIGTYEGRLQDGTGYRIPMWGWFGPDGKDMENVGVKPDITVEPSEQDIEQRRDRQLETAVDVLIKELPKEKKAG